MDDNLIVEKIKKLLALAKSSNENEAAAALAKAHKLLRDYDLTLEDVEAKEQSVFCLDLLTFSREQAWKAILAKGIAEYNYCKILKSQSVVQTSPRKSKVVSCYQVYGSEVDVLVCKEMFDYLVKAVLIITRGNSNQKQETSHKNSFKLGVTYSLCERMARDSDEEQNQSDSKELVVSYRNNRNAEIDRHWEDLGFLVKSQKYRSRTVYKDAFDQGFEKGKKISLAKQIKGKK
ncbi:MAG: DUF2786 domain-containing protein [Spirochaetales bacterium]|nr:DUF2786 domain-containing protein [Spirochaetales bacterium]